MRMNYYLMNRVKRSNCNHNNGEDGAVREGDHTWLREAKSRTEERGQKKAEDNRNQRTTQSESRGQRIEPSLRLGSQRAQGSTLSLVPSEKTSPSVSSGVTYTYTYTKDYSASAGTTAEREGGGEAEEQ